MADPLLFRHAGTLSTGNRLTIAGHFVHHRRLGVIREPVPCFTMVLTGSTPSEDGACIQAVPSPLIRGTAHAIAEGDHLPKNGH